MVDAGRVGKVVTSRGTARYNTLGQGGEHHRIISARQESALMAYLNGAMLRFKAACSESAAPDLHGKPMIQVTCRMA